MGGRYTTRIHVSPDHRRSYALLVADSKFPPNTLVASLLYDSHDDELVAIYAMRKVSESKWDYSVVDADGRLRKTGALPVCIRCHSEALGDSLFGMPRRNAP